MILLGYEMDLIELIHCCSIDGWLIRLENLLLVLKIAEKPGIFNLAGDVTCPSFS
jgi:hypothetical protein